MDTKLTLNLNQEVIEAAKQYAKEQGQSLSAIVESYIKSLVQNRKSKTRKKKEDKENWDWVNELAGSVKWKDVDDIVFKDEYDKIRYQALKDKYLK